MKFHVFKITAIIQLPLYSHNNILYIYSISHIFCVYVFLVNATFFIWTFDFPFFTSHRELVMEQKDVSDAPHPHPHPHEK